MVLFRRDDIDYHSVFAESRPCHCGGLPGRPGCGSGKRHRNVALMPQALVNFERSEAGEIGGD
jgi:hypothetical protein